MRIAVVAANFTPGEADQLRRAMAAWKRGGDLTPFQTRLMKGMLDNGYKPEFAEVVFKQISGFAEYGFPESHAASFALLVYASAWMKHYHPAVFLAAMINAQPLGFYTVGQLARDAIGHGVRVLPIDVNRSQYACGIEGTPPAVRLGLRVIRGISAEKVAGIAAAQQEGPIMSIRPLAQRGDVSREALLRLAAADAFRSLGLDRRQALWQILALDHEQQHGLFEVLEPDEPAVSLPKMTLEETVEQDYDALGFSLNAHPIGLVRPELTRQRVMPNAKLRTAAHGRGVRVAGLVTVRQRPMTAKGMVFMTLEDETGMANLIVRPPVWDREGRKTRHKVAVVAEGVVERQGKIVHVQVGRLHDLSQFVVDLPHRSRDFR